MTGLVYDDRFLLHRAPYEHPENPGRLVAIRDGLEGRGLLARCERVRDGLAQRLLDASTALGTLRTEAVAQRGAVGTELSELTRELEAEAAARGAAAKEVAALLATE